MSGHVRMAVEFVEADAEKRALRFVIAIEDWSDAPESVPIRIAASTGAKDAIARRLAVVKQQGSGWTEVTSSGGKAITYTPSEPQIAGGGRFTRWLVHVELERGQGARYLVVTHPRAARVSKQIAAAPAQLNSGAPAAVSLLTEGFPRLCEAIDGATVTVATTPSGDPSLGNASDIRVVLEHIFARLRTPSSAESPKALPDALVEAWSSQKAVPLALPVPPGRRLVDAEEAWARKVTEMTAFAPYAGSGQTYFGDGAKDHELIASRLQDGSSADPVFPLTFACQHLSHFAVACRGRAAHVGKPFGKYSGLKGVRLINAGSSSALTVHDMGGAWIVGDKPPRRAEPNQGQMPAWSLDCGPELRTGSACYAIDSEVPTHEFAPGAVFVFSNRRVRPQGVDPASTKTFNYHVEVRHENGYECTYAGSPSHHPLRKRWRIGQGGLLADNTAEAHVGVVLRIDRTQREKFQVLDTGGLGVKGHGKGVGALPSAATSQAGNWDSPPTTQVTGGDPHRGVGVWLRMTAADGDALYEHVRKVLMRARPLGFARLFITRAGVDVTPKLVLSPTIPTTEWLVYASPLLRMYADAPEQNYAIARYLWSLRGLQRGMADVWWSIYAPREALARAMLDAGRTASVEAIAQAAHARIKHPLAQRKVAPNGSLDVARLLVEYTLPLVDMKAQPGGGVQIMHRYPNAKGLWGTHLAERVGWDKKLRVPMDRAVLASGESPAAAGFPAYFLK